jgi:hypothetical protein
MMDKEGVPSSSGIDIIDGETEVKQVLAESFMDEFSEFTRV